MAKKIKKYKEDDEYFGMLRRVIISGAKRAGDGDELELKEFAWLRHNAQHKRKERSDVPS